MQKLGENRARTVQMFLIGAALCLPVFCSLTSPGSGFGFTSGEAVAAELPPVLLDLMMEDHALPRYHEAYYHPLGRNPVVDAVLGDPFYLPSYGRQVSLALRSAAERGDCERVLATSLRAGAMTCDEPRFRDWLSAAGLNSASIPGLEKEIGAMDARLLTRAWQLFLLARGIAETELTKLSELEQDSLRLNPEAYFFGEAATGEYAYFTGDTARALETFRLAARLDLRELARAQRCLAFAADMLRSQATGLGHFSGRFDWTVPRGQPGAGCRLLLAGKGHDLHAEDADFLIDVGGDDIYRNNAGGTRGLLPAAFLLDLGGNDLYEGDFAVQGAGFLGVGALVDLAGDDFYQAVNFSQGAAWLGCGLLIDIDGHDEYRGDFFVQSAAAYGHSLLWDAGGDDSYEAMGFAQAASTTLGTAFLVDSEGGDRYRCGRHEAEFWTKSIGVGQGGAVGLRDYPWKTKPSFYGGVAFLDDAAGNDQYYCPVFCQGGAYVFSVGVLCDGGGDDRFVNRSDGLGAVVHLAAGLFVKEGGNDVYDGAWGSAGVGGDRGVGVFVDTGGDDRHIGGAHNIGTARKPKALGLFIDLAGDDDYSFSGESCGHVQRPADPEAWPFALFLDLGGNDRYPVDHADSDGLGRGNERAWTYHAGAAGLDTTLILSPDADIYPGALTSAEEFFAQLPAMPRVDFPFDPLRGWVRNVYGQALLSAPTPEDSEDNSAAGSLLSDTPALVGAASAEEAGSPLQAAPAQANETSPPPQMAYASSAEQNLYDFADGDSLLVPASAETPSTGPGAEYLARLNGVVLPSYDERRRLYEQLDLLRFERGPFAKDLLPTGLLTRLPGAPVDLAAWVSLWAELDSLPELPGILDRPLREDRIISAYARRLMIRAVAVVGDEIAQETLRNRLPFDPDELCRREAALGLARIGGIENLASLALASDDSSAAVRQSLCRGLRDSESEGALALLLPLLDDPDVFVRRGACVSAISLGHKPAVDKLLAGMGLSSLDTGENYGHNLFADISKYLGNDLYERFGVDLDKWQSWWSEARQDFDLPAAIAAEKER